MLNAPTYSGSIANELSKGEIERYSRHLLIPEVSVSGQKKLKGAKVLCVGTGGLGSPVIMYLAGAGVGCIGLVDFDTVDVSNLQRQIVHGTKDIGRSKLLSAKETIEDINPNVLVDLFEVTLSAKNAIEIFERYDLVIDGTDNFSTRYLVNDACVLLDKPNVYGSVMRFEGQASIFSAKDGPCYRCLYPEPPPEGLIPSCSEGGVLGVLPGMVGLIQATEAIKLILGIGETLVGRLKLFDALSMNLKELKVRKDPSCPICGNSPEIKNLIDYEQFCGVATDIYEAEKGRSSTMSAIELKARIINGYETLIIDVREPHEFEICQILGAKSIPLNELEARVGEIDENVAIVACCRSGSRSAKAVEILSSAGFTNVKSLAGGIVAWSTEVDSSMPKY